MYALVRPFVQLCLLRSRPQDLPVSGTLLGFALVAHTTTGILISLILLPGFKAILAGLAGTLLLSALTVGVLSVQGRMERLFQTLTALAGAITVLDVMGLPVTSWLEKAHASGGDRGTPTLVLFLLTGWSLMVQGHVLRHALSTRFFLGLMLSVFFFWISVNVMRTLFPIPV